MKPTAWNHLSSVSDQTQTSSALGNKWGLEPARLCRGLWHVIDWWAENKLPLSTPIVSDFPAWGRGHWGQSWRIYFPISVSVGGEKYEPLEGEKGKKGRHCTLLSRVRFRQSSCLTDLWHEGEGRGSLCLQHLLLNATHRYQGSTDWFLADTLFFQLHVKIRDLWDERRKLMEQLARSAHREMQ